MVEIRSSAESETNRNQAFVDEAHIKQHAIKKFCDTPLDP